MILSSNDKLVPLVDCHPAHTRRALRHHVVRLQHSHCHQLAPLLSCLKTSLLGRVALVRGIAAYSLVIKLSRGRSVGLSMRTCVGLSSALWKNGGSDPDAVWHHRSDGSRDEVGSGVLGSVHGKEYFLGEFGARHCNQWGLYGVRVRQCRDALLLWAELLIGLHL